MGEAETLAMKEKRVGLLLAAGRRAEAMELLFELVVAHAVARRFDHAEKLQQQMMDVDAMALSLIVSAAERIEEEKNRAIDRVHMERWKAWYARLLPEERSAFFFACEPLSFSPGTTLFRQGEGNTSLYFVDQGVLQLFAASDKGQEVLVRRVGPGDLAGEDTFYKSSVCTTRLVALTAGSCQVLSREALMVLDETVAGLGPKLRAFCSQGRSPSEMLQAKGVNRRAHKRIPAQGVIVFQVLSGEKKGATASLLKGRMADISAGGLSFYVKTANGRGIRQLLGRYLGMKFLLTASGNPQPLVCKGVVTGVLCHMDNEYSIHVKFDKLLNPMLFV